MGGRLRHGVKLVLLFSGLAFLFWWGWAGHFAFDKGTFLRLLPQEDLYRLELGNKVIGHSLRIITLGPDAGRFNVEERTLITITLAMAPQIVKMISKSSYDDQGRLIEAEIALPFAQGSAKASAKVIGDKVKCSLSFNQKERNLELALPKEGPVVASGLIPWLSHQNQLPLGRPLTLSLLDLSTISFSQAQLIVEDVTEESDEVQRYKLTLNFKSSESQEWIEANGRILRHYEPGLGVNLILETNELEIIKAKKELEQTQFGELKGLTADFLDLALKGEPFEFFKPSF
ncbi:MAG: hypothetical protein LBV23_08605 [Deltaproteobacteria bacterium]|nr:hypothetical protein [Deltaproteobacteria bacterium]